MSIKEKYQKQSKPVTQLKPLRHPASPPPGKGQKTLRLAQPWQHLVFIAIIVQSSFFTFMPALNNQFLKTWDDSVYVTGNKLLNDLTVKNIKEIFSFHKDLQKLTKNYHPLTTLSLALNHQLAGLSPRSYYFTNILIHSLNAVLVYLLIFLLSGRKIWGALLAGLLFAVHPMHVESVAWISERKDVLYALFFISGLIAYYYYLKEKKIIYLVFVILLFFFSVLSKAMAVVFPLVLLLLDILLQRKWSVWIVVEKIPFFIISIFFGMLAIRIQSEGAINEWQTFTLYQRMMHASFGFVSYLLSLFSPAHLSAFYPYPAINEHGQLPMIFSVSPFIFVFMLTLSIACLFLKNRLAKVFGFGMLFYFVTLALVLQFLSVGKAITADRYTYIPYIGLLFIVAAFWSFLLEHRKPFVKIAGIVTGVLFLVISVSFSISSYHRTSVWHDDIALWTDVLDQYPDVRTNFIRIKRADLNFLQQDYEKAMQDYRVMASLDPRDDYPLERIGRIYGQQYHQIDSALLCFKKAYGLNPDNLQLLKNMGVAYGVKNDFPASLNFLLAAYKKDTVDTELMRNIATTYRSLGNKEKANEFDRLSMKKK